jgi:hypothetical protein
MSELNSIPQQIQEEMSETRFRGGAAKEQIAAAAAALGVTFPQDYVDFLVETNGGSFRLGDSYAELYEVQRLLEDNGDPEEGFPAYLKVFGDNGGSEKYAFDTRTAPHPIVVVPPYEPEESDLISQGSTLAAFLGRMLRNELFDDGTVPQS